MNQKQVHTLRKLFVRAAPFLAGDPRLKASWRRAKKSYNQVPRPLRAAYLKRIEAEVETAEFIKSSETA